MTQANQLLLVGGQGQVFCGFAPNLVYRLQNWLFPMPRETYDTVIYSFLGMFKIAFLFFNLVPYLALRIMG